MSKKEKSMRERVEEWLDMAPEGLTIGSQDIDIYERQELIRVIGKKIPELIKGGFEGTIRFRTKEW